MPINQTDVTAVSMLTDLHQTLRRSGIELRVAREMGQFRDVIRTAAPDSTLQVFPIVADALADRNPDTEHNSE